MISTPKNEQVEAMDLRCGKALDPKRALKLSWAGKTYFFCSEECRRQFEWDPPGDEAFWKECGFVESER